MLDEQQESAADDRGEVAEEASTTTAPAGERPSDEPVDAAKGPDAGEEESRHSGEEEDPIRDQAQTSASGETGDV